MIFLLMKYVYPERSSMNRSNHHTILRTATLVSGVCISFLFVWFAGYHYRLSTRLAEENLNGLALSLSAAVETLVAHDPTFASLRGFQTSDIAYFTLVAPDGAILFHGNDALIGSRLADRRYRSVFDKGEFSGRRVRLGTGETIYESHFPIHLNGSTLALRLALHTYRADSVIRMARIGLFVVIALVSTAWGMALLLLKYAGREAVHRKEMLRRRELARLGEMGAVIAHEIRNPLAGIKGYAQLLEEKLQLDEDGEFAQVIVSEATRLEEIVNGLLAYTQEAPKAHELVGINDVVACSLDLIAPEASASGIVMNNSLDQSLTIMGNRDRLEQLFLNLFRNALQAMPNGGHITIDGYRHGDRIELLVADSGSGIDGNNLGRVFEPFFTTRARGSGLGLAVCKKIVDEHGGTIRVESVVGHGTTFRIQFAAPGGVSVREER